MKHVFLGSITLTLLLVACVLFSCAICHAAEDVNGVLSDAISTDSTDACAAYMEDAAMRWKDRQRILGIFLHHDEADEIAEDLEQLCSYAQSEDSDDFFSICSSLQEKLEHICEMQWPYLHNIL